MKIAILFLLISFWSANKEKPFGATESINLSETFCVGDELVLGNSRIKFSRVISDSRCPESAIVTCIWAGEVKILLEHYEGNELKSSRIIRNSVSEINEFLAGTGVSVGWFEVLPHPEKPEILKQEDYSFKFQISERLARN